jgi:acyl-CoA thioester hydrolase
MMRVKIDLPQKYIFSTEINVRIGDVNYGGHVGNDAILSLAHDIRMQFFNSNGYSEMDIEGTSLIMADAMVAYKGEAFFGDVLIGEMAIINIHRAGFDLVYRLSNKLTSKDVAHIKTGMICFDYENKKIQPVPEKLKLKFASYEH